ncbi:MAG: hypothetical protein DMF90_29755, partial [Acidobacteria bacterium]
GFRIKRLLEPRSAELRYHRAGGPFLPGMGPLAYAPSVTEKMAARHPRLGGTWRVATGPNAEARRKPIPSRRSERRERRRQKRPRRKPGFERTVVRP